MMPKAHCHVVTGTDSTSLVFDVGEPMSWNPNPKPTSHCNHSSLFPSSSSGQSCPTLLTDSSEVSLDKLKSTINKDHVLETKALTYKEEDVKKINFILRIDESY